ncbi:hypothetical protein BDL97_02G143600 [Sphagnum fallax]|nr:hypothetical protein BDL97_02G143600 [Sphagnum fallax]
MAGAIASAGIGSVSRHKEQNWVPGEKPGCSQTLPITMYELQAVQLFHTGCNRGRTRLELARIAMQHHGAHQQICLASYFTPKFSKSRKLLHSLEKKTLYGVKICVQIWCQVVREGVANNTLVAGWSEQTEEAAASWEAGAMGKPSGAWATLLSANVKLGKEKVNVIGRQVKVVVKEVTVKEEHVGRSLEAMGVRSSALAKCMEQGAGMTEGQMAEWKSTLQHLGLKHSDIVAAVGKDAAVLRAKTANVRQVWQYLIDQLGLDRDTLSCMCVQWPGLLLCTEQQIRDLSKYLQSVGISADEVPGILASRPQLLGHPIERIQHSVQCLLQAGVQPGDLARILKKVPELFSDVTQKNLKAKLEFLLSAGLGAGLGKAVARRPNILNYNLDSMKSTAQYLQSLMRTHDVAKLVKRYAEVLVLDPQRKMYPIINYLLILGVKQEDLGKVILRRPQLLGYTIPGLVPTVDYLLELGVKPQMLGKVITTSPQVLTLNVEEKLKPVVEFFRSIGLNRERDMEMLLVRNAQIMCCSIEKNLRPKFTFFKGIGLTESAIANMIVLFPSMLGQSIEGSLAPKYEFLVNEMQRSIDEVIDFPQYFGYSLENRIKPRHKKLKDKAIATSLASMLACVDLDFNTRYMSGHSPTRAPYKSRSKIGR